MPGSGLKHAEVGGRSRGRLAPRRAVRWVQHLAVTLIGAIGLSLIMYPSTATWLYKLAQSQVVTAYVDSTTAIAPEVRTDLISQAEQYNSTLPPGPFRDPYAVVPGTDSAAAQAATAKYNSMLAADQSGVMARLRITKIEVDLPVYHGVDDGSLAQGVGHLPASSLPIGGPGTHAVLVGHTGLANAPLLTDLNKLVVGDTFMIDIYGETLYYQVDHISVVLPSDMSQLQIVSGMDYVTLVTCTPKWVNTYRLLVRGVRVAAPQEDTMMIGHSALTPQQGPGLPWWALIILAGTLAAYLVSVFVLKPKREALIAARRAIEERSGLGLIGLTEDQVDRCIVNCPILLALYSGSAARHQ